MTFVDYFAFVMLAFKALLFFVACVFLVSGFDDLVVDVVYFVRNMYRAIFIWQRYKPITEQQLLSIPEQPIAVMIPAWNESAIIYHMVNNTVNTLNYSNFHVFIGTYPNDLDTQREVARLREIHDNVHCIVCRDPGPTSKADCLNWVYWGIRDFEKEHGFEFPVFVMEDAEDIVHPLAIKLFNYLIPRKNMVQLPVVPFEPQHWYQLTRAHYMDEFAENHHKNMVIREVFNRGIPCAGVGCGFSRHALELLASDNEQHLVFKLGSLTEDYEMGMRLRTIGVDKAIFVKMPIKRTITRKSLLTGRNVQVEKEELVSIRNVFPSKFSASVRQKSRWIAGIALQGWENLGWKGDLLTKYVLFKDRKALVTSQVNMLGYLVILFSAAYYAAMFLYPDAYHYPPLVEEGTLLWNIILITTVFLVLRLVVRMYCVLRYYNLKRAFLSVLNFVWGNFINFFATNRAIFMFSRYLITGKWIKWDHTTHVPPSEEELTAFRRRIGDMLVEKRIISFEQLEGAIREQQKTGRLLGDILMLKGLVNENELIQTLGMQLRISTREIDPYETPLELLRLLPRELAVLYSVFPVERKNNKLIVAASTIPRRDELSKIEAVVGSQIELCLTTKNTLSFSIQRGYQRLQEKARAKPLGQLLLDRKLLTREQLAEALRRQRQTYARLGDILLDESLVPYHVLNQAFEEHADAPEERLGEFMVRKGYIFKEQLDLAMNLQKMRFRSLGEIVTEMQLVQPDVMASILDEMERMDQTEENDLDA